MPLYFEKMPKQEISKPQRMRFGLAAMPERKAQELPQPERLKYRSGRCAPPPPYFGHDGGSETIMRQVPAHMPMFLQDNRQGAFLSAATILQQRPDCRTTPICRGKIRRQRTLFVAMFHHFRRRQQRAFSAVTNIGCNIGLPFLFQLSSLSCPDNVRQGRRLFHISLGRDDTAPELLRELRLRGQRVNGFFSSRRLYPQPGRVSLANSGGWRLYPSSATARRKSSSGLRGSCSSRPLLPKRTL